MGVDKSSVAAVKVQGLALLYLGFLSRAPLSDDAIFAGDDCGQIDLYVCCADAPSTCIARSRRLGQRRSSSWLAYTRC